MKVDIAIVGAGLTGMSLAVGLARSGRRVAVIDARAAAPGLAPGAVFDTRIYAISPASRRWLEELRVWSAMDASRLTPVYDMQVFADDARDLSGGLPLSSYKAGVGELCTIVEEGEIASVLDSAARFAPGLEILRPVTPVALELTQKGAVLALSDGRQVEASLVIASDGARSWTRQAAGIGVDLTDYRQTAVVANFACEKPHRNRALQWFRDDEGASGILAWLPLPGNHISIVWSAPTGVAESLMGLAPEDFAARVEAAGLAALGRLTLVDARGAFPLRNQRAHRSVGTRLALVGDAAHVIHPLAGYGLNLGFGDCVELFQRLEGRADCGDPQALRGFERARKAALFDMHTVTHGLASLFAIPHPAARMARNLGLNLAGRLPVISNWLVRQAVRG